jgi:hypothetical protein
VIQRFLLTAFILILSSGIIFSQSIIKPEVIKFGENKSNIMIELDKICKINSDRQISPPELPTATKTQSQLDVEKFMYAGKKRKAEFIFADGILDMVWIFTEAAEEDTLIAGFTKLYGKPTHVRDDVTFFLNAGVAVRNDPHEVLFISDRLKAPYKKWLEQ